MNDLPESSYAKPPLGHESPWNTRVTIITLLASGLALGVSLWFASHNSANAPYVPSKSTSHFVYPQGIPDSSEPSGMAPPAANALAGYTQTYVNDFLGISLPPGWESFTGTPGGDPGGQFAASHVVVSGGLLRLNTWKDPQYQDKWVTGGLCQCKLAKTYGAYFVRSRVTGPGPNEVELLWPASNAWPPEIDFNESGGALSGTSSTVHFSTINLIDQRSITIDMSQWHTWGVVWTPSKILYIVDGHDWSSIESAYEVPAVPMTLDLEQRAMCQLGRQCPTSPVSMLVDWIAEYSSKVAPKP
jgi:hypothetical protein